MALDSLRGDREFRKVRAHGQAVRDPLFTLRVTEYRPRHGEAWRPRAIIGVVVSKKTLKRAVDRNRARRRVREALRTLPGGLPACRAILLPNPAVLTAPFADLQAALERALRRAPSRGGKPGRGGGNQGRAGRVPAPVPPVSPQPALDSPEPDPHGGTA
ncbi:ribonuclease P protein component [Deinococcus radiotolerans]|uniref:Ribonuclease P protein component n=1 Tax=Deinococcus radiotolerans TaxID=1309407 RepID=A0ABQ2FQA9_9DEIO|nr:ribonuclease P protein component [Deinococcus radiotolerans]GGL16175.1 ribonuclease P protein component [Deinococcus radiotolerans]